MAIAERYLLSFEEYAQIAEHAQGIKLEWIDGVIYGMAGGTPEHAEMILTVGALLRGKLKSKGCRTFASDLMVLTPSKLSTYPDITVVCGPVQTYPTSKNTVINPTLLVEVLSPTTEAYDRGAKFEHYKSIPTLTDYLLVSVDKQNVDHWSKNSKGEWECVPSDSINVLGIHFTVKELYDP